MKLNKYERKDFMATLQKIISPKQLDEEQQILFEQAYESKKRYALTTWLLFIFLGELGAHDFYLGSLLRGVIRLLLSIVAILSFAAFISSDVNEGIPTAGIGSPFLVVVLALILWKLINLFTLQKQIYKSNKKIEQNILEKFN